AFGLVMGIALVVGINAVATYRDLSRATAAFQSGALAVADQLRSAHVAWKARSYLLTTEHPDAAHLKELEDAAKSSLEEAQAHAGDAIKSGVTTFIGQLTTATTLQGAPAVEAVKSVDAGLQDLVDS